MSGKQEFRQQEEEQKTRGLSGIPADHESGGSTSRPPNAAWGPSSAPCPVPMELLPISFSVSVSGGIPTCPPAFRGLTAWPHHQACVALIFAPLSYVHPVCMGSLLQSIHLLQSPSSNVAAGFMSRNPLGDSRW